MLADISSWNREDLEGLPQASTWRILYWPLSMLGNDSGWQQGEEGNEHNNLKIYSSHLSTPWLDLNPVYEASCLSRFLLSSMERGRNTPPLSHLTFKSMGSFQIALGSNLPRE